MSKTSYIHKRIFLHAIRTAIIFVSGFIIYEILVKLEKKWNNANPSNSMFHFHKRNSIKFILIFCTDLVLLYMLHLLFRVDL
jgi:uncharacterized membrane protein YidH (DUF202 family)